MFTLRVVPDDGEPFEVTTTSRDIVQWEAGGTRQNPRSMGQLGGSLRMSDLTDLAWYAAERRGLTDLDSKQWRTGVDVDLTARADEEPLLCPSCGAEVPTEPDQEEDSEGSGPTRTDR
jgi:hypothetical protein